MADLLNFNSDRELVFDPRRPLAFDFRRPLEFDPRRELEFNPNRNLGFGRRGVVFRGFVCPICGALVTEDAKRCNECGTVFEGSPRAGGPAPSAPPTKRAPAEKGKPARAPPSGQGPAPPAGAAYCAYCGVMLRRADAFCWNCGARTAGASEVVKLPAQKTPSVMREWRTEK